MNNFSIAPSYVSSIYLLCEDLESIYVLKYVVLPDLGQFFKKHGHIHAQRKIDLSPVYGHYLLSHLVTISNQVSPVAFGKEIEVWEPTDKASGVSSDQAILRQVECERLKHYLALSERLVV